MACGRLSRLEEADWLVKFKYQIVFQEVILDTSSAKC